MFLGDKDTRTLFSIECQTYDIKEFSSYPTEDEMLMLPGMKLEVKSVASLGNDLWMVQLQQMKTPPMFE